MIYGVGSDIVSVQRMGALYARFGARLTRRLLAGVEAEEMVAALAAVADPGRWLAKRFAAKEAFAKAVGTGLRAPVSLTGIAVAHDPQGKPALVFAAELQDWLRARGVAQVHLSLSDERDYAIAMVIAER